MQNTGDFLLELGQLKEDHVTQLSASFNNLPKSNYLDGDYRLRRYSHFNFSANVLKKMPAKAFEQSANLMIFKAMLHDNTKILSKASLILKPLLKSFHASKILRIWMMRPT